jgi:hypothetical protein
MSAAEFLVYETLHSARVPYCERKRRLYFVIKKVLIQLQGQGEEREEYLS